MPWTLEYNPEFECTELTYIGTITGADLAAASAARIALNRETGTNRALVDATQIQLEASLFDLLNIPAQIFENEKIDRRLSIALIMPSSKEMQNTARFFQMVCANRGWNVTLFPDRESAIEWLLKQPNTAKTEE